MSIVYKAKYISRIVYNENSSVNFHKLLNFSVSTQEQDFTNLINFINVRFDTYIVLSTARMCGGIFFNLSP